MAKRNRNRTSKRAAKESSSLHKPMVFDRSNYQILLLGILLILSGFTIMRMENEVYGFISLYVAPIIIFGGYITVIVAVLKRKKKPVDDQETVSAS
mgnify:CR=1 FL=1